MKDFFKVLGTAIVLGAAIFKAIKKAKDKHEKEAIYKACADHDLQRLRDLVFK
jgi:hypothetical protein